jgi:hypothetical protein
MIRRRRPLLRAAMLGGVGYATYRAGKRGAEQAQRETEQGAQPAPPQRDAAAGPAEVPPAASDTDRLATLARLKELLDSGALTPQEFDAEKRRILRGQAGRGGRGAAGR